MAERPAVYVPIFSERLTEVLGDVFDGKAPNAGRFCGYCFTPIDADRVKCTHCSQSTQELAPVPRVPGEVLEMFRLLRKRESLVVNSFAYAGLFSAVLIFVGLFYVFFTTGSSVWWYVFDIVLLFVLARVLAGLLGGYVGDEVGYSYARRKLAEEWVEYEAMRDQQTANVQSKAT